MSNYYRNLYNTYVRGGIWRGYTRGGYSRYYGFQGGTLTGYGRYRSRW